MPATPALAESSWQFGVSLPGEGPVELSAVDVIPGQTWVGGTQVSPRTGKAEPVVGLEAGGTLNRVPGPAVDPSLDVHLSDLAVIGDDVLVVANATASSGLTQPVVQRYSRTRPGESEVLPGPVGDAYTELNAIRPLADGRAVTVGTTGSKPTSTETLILEQDLSGWRRVPSPSPGTETNQLNAVTVVAATSWAAGHYTHRDEPGRSHPLVLYDEGSGDGWTQLSVPDPGPEFADLTGIAVTDDGDVFVAGWAGPAYDDPDQRTAIAMRWNKSTWELLRLSGAEVTQFNDVAVAPDGTVLFAGYVKTGLTSELADLEKWTGDPQLQQVSILLPSDQAGAPYPGSGINAIDAATADARPCAVGWLRGQPDQVGATLRPTPALASSSAPARAPLRAGRGGRQVELAIPL